MKTAISIPNTIFEQAEKLAKQKKVSRSELYTAAIRSYIDENQIDDITARLDQVYQDHDSSVDPLFARAQLKSLPKEEW